MEVEDLEIVVIETIPPTQNKQDPRSAKRSLGSSKSAWILRLFPFFTSGLLYSSVLFGFFAPLPLLLFRLAYPKKTWSFGLALLSNSVVVLALRGPELFGVYWALVGSLAVLIPGALQAPKTGLSGAPALDRAIWSSVLGVFLVTFSMVVGLSLIQGAGIPTLVSLRNSVFLELDILLTRVGPEVSAQWLGDLSPAEWKLQTFREIPSTFLLGVLGMTWLNLLMLLRVNPRGIRERLGLLPNFIVEWRAPNWLIWPSLLLWAVVLWAPPAWSQVSFGGLKVCLALYGIQGLSILAFVLERFKIFGFFRLFTFGVALFLLMPAVLSAGFFDQWFDFRKKFRQF